MSHCSSGIRHISTFASINLHIRRERSTNVTWLAPRESASIPTAPEPAHRSRNRAPSITGAITLKSVSRRRSDVGRTFSDGGLFRFRPLYSPAIIRMCYFERRGQAPLPDLFYPQLLKSSNRTE